MCVCVDLIIPYTLKDKDGIVMDFMCLTMVDPASGWFELIELPNTSITCTRKGKEATEVVIDKSSAQISKLFNKKCLSLYPRAKYIVYDNGRELKLHFSKLCHDLRLNQKLTSVKNPKASTIL